MELPSVARLGGPLQGLSLTLWPLGSNRGSIPHPTDQKTETPRVKRLRGFRFPIRSARDSNPQALSGARFRGECNTILPALQNGFAPTVLGGHPPER